MTIAQVLEKLCAYHPKIDEAHTCDVVKCGDPQVECTGIITTVCPTVEVVRAAIAQKANLIIVHEPAFYSNEDAVDWLEGNPTYEEKAALLKEHNIVIFRDHDRLHGGSPKRIRMFDDLVFTGIMKELGWEEYCIGVPKKPLMYEIPETTVRELAQWLIQRLHLNGARVVGDLDAKVRRVLFCEHISGANWGGHAMDSEAIQEVEEKEFDVMIPFEIVDWTLSAYVRDSAQLGRGKALIEMGHFNVEELAMKHMARWLPEVIGPEVPVQFVQAGDCFQYLLAK